MPYDTAAQLRNIARWRKDAHFWRTHADLTLSGFARADFLRNAALCERISAETVQTLASLSVSLRVT